MMLLLETVTSHAPDIHSNMEGLANQIAVTDHRTRKPGILSQPERFQAALGMSEEATTMCKSMAVPRSEGPPLTQSLSRP